MYGMPEGFKDAVHSMNRTVGLVISIGTGIDMTAADDLSSVEGDFLPMSNPLQLTDDVYDMTDGLATFEGEGIPTSADNGLVAPPVSAAHNPPEVGAWSAPISDGEGVLDFTFTLTFGRQHTSALRVYTSGPNVLQASVLYDGVAQEVTYAQGYFGVKAASGYTTISITVSKIDQPYHHLRIAELQFGDSVSLNNSMLAGDVSNIRELDPVETSIPLDELDLSILNVEGEFDIDNPNTRLAEFSVGFPITLAYTVEGEDAKRYTVPYGQYYIGEWGSTDTRLSITAFDGRWILSEAYAAWTIPSDVSLGQTIDDVLAEYNVPHTIDSDVFGIFPDSSHTYDDTTSILDNLLHIQQAYRIYLLPGHDGVLRVTRSWPSGDSGTVPVSTLYSWPSPRQLYIYNFVTVGYYTKDEQGNDVVNYVNRDLRKHPTESKTPVQIIGNPLIVTVERATELMNRIVSRIYSSEVETDWMGDPSIDVGDSVAVPGKWTQDDPLTYRASYMELIFDGVLSARMRCNR